MAWSPDPPDSLAPERLFRLLLSPLPSLPIQFRFAGFEGYALSVCAIPAQQLVGFEDAASHLGGEHRATSFWASVIAQCLLAGGRRVFVDAAEVMGLHEQEFTALRLQVESTLCLVGPTYAHSSWAAWHSILCKGAAHHTNASAYTGLAASYDVGGGIAKPRFIERPDRYFGVPMNRLLDGHWMVHSASRATFESKHK